MKKCETCQEGPAVYWKRRYCYPCYEKAIQALGEKKKIDDVITVAMYKQYRFEKMTDRDICQKIGFGPEVLRRWRKKNGLFVKTKVRGS